MKHSWKDTSVSKGKVFIVDTCVNCACQRGERQVSLNPAGWYGGAKWVRIWITKDGTELDKAPSCQ